MKVLRFVLSLWTSLTFVNAYNADTTVYGIVNGPSRNSYFGYSTETHEANGKLKLWTGSPKYKSHPDNTSASEGAIYSCEMVQEPTSSNSNIDLTNNCEKLRFSASSLEPSRNDTEGEDASSSLPQIASSCSFGNNMCGYNASHPDAWLRKTKYDEIRSSSSGKKRNTRFRWKNCYRHVKVRSILSGPRDTANIQAGLIALDPDQYLHTIRRRTWFRTNLTSPVMQSPAVNQCLRFCFNAFSLLDEFSSDHEKKLKNESITKRLHRTYLPPVRSLKVYMKSDNMEETLLYKFSNPGQIASKYWNFTEIDFNHTANANYQLVFKVSILNTVKNRGCSPASDIVLTDITISNRRCKDEAESADTLEDEQSVGMTLNVEKDEQGENILTTCGSLWQQNCGFAKESTGVCYQYRGNSSQPKVIRNPELKGCIRGKMDIVMLIDQSGSVNQCNFQKIKRWMRNIIRGFEIGPHEQDIAVVIYSSRSDAKTKDVIGLGFGKYGNNGDEKKKSMLKILNDVSYMGGQTYTGLAFQHANNMLLGPQARPDALKMIILLTDGATTSSDRGRLNDQVKISKQHNVSILAVGVAGYDEKELKGISGEENFFGVTDFSELDKVRNTLRLAVSNVQLEGSKRSKSMQNCQMGFSLSGNQDSVVMGAPGCFDHVGDSFSYGSYSDKIVNQSAIQPTERSIIHDVTLQPDTETEASKIISIPTLEDLEGVLTKSLGDSYLGYAVGVGRFFGEAEGSYNAASAPRYDGMGCVIIYRASSSNAFGSPHILMGQKYGEYFGAAITVEDVNSDGFTDLFVGAPLYTDIEPDEGRVYVYMGGNQLSKNPDVILKGSGKPFSRFGSVISSVGDMNADHVPDIVVSAPNEDEGHGAIYIFPGYKNGILSQYSQRISASDLSVADELYLFGQSVSGNVDIDHNGYNDIFVGTPGSDQIVILRSRPVVRITPRFLIRDKVIDRRNENCWSGSNATITTVAMNTPCLQCMACFSYHGQSIPATIEVRYEIYPDILMTKPRMKFHENIGHQFLEQTVMLYGVGKEFCFNNTLYLEKDIDDMMTKVEMQMKFDMIANNTDDVEGSVETGDILVPALDIYTEKTLKDTAYFKLDCQHNLSCKADISVVKSHAVSSSGENLMILDYVPKTTFEFILELENIGLEEAHAVVIDVGFSSDLSYSGTTSKCFKVDDEGSSFVSKDNFKHLDFSLRKTFLRAGETCVGRLTFIVMSIAEKHRSEFIQMYVNSSTISLNDSLENNGIKMTVPLQYRSSFSISGYAEQSEIYQPTFTPEVNSTGSADSHVLNILHKYTIRNTGKLTLRNLTLRVLWPLCISVNGSNLPINYDGTMMHGKKHTVFLNDFRLLNTSSVCNVDNTSLVKSTNYCISDSVSLCSYITIFVPKIPRYDFIIFSINGSMEWSNVTVIREIFKLTSEVSIPRNESIGLFPPDQIFDYTISTVILPPFQSTQKKEIEVVVSQWWIYIISAAIGIILLLFSAFAMSKAGFFKSKYADKKKLAEEDSYFIELCQPMTSTA